MKGNFDKTVEFVGLNPKTEKAKITFVFILFIILGVACYFLLKNLLISIMALVFGVALGYFFLTSYSRKKTKIISERNDEFISIINYFQTFVSNKNNVYQSFNKLIEYSSEWMSKRIEQFLFEIDRDKSVKPFIDFASEFSLTIARNVMLSIYQMVDQGESEMQMAQFTFIFEQMNNNHLTEMKKRKESGLEITAIFPMIGAVLVMISLTLCILSSIGDLANVV